MRQRWVVFIAALAGSAVLATGFAVAADRLVGAGVPPPHLRTVSDAALAQAGYTLGAAAVPPYCGAEQQVARRGWLPQGAVGCPLSQDAAVAAATRGSSSQAVESVLARVSSSAAGGGGESQVLWLVVVRSSIVMTPMIACARPANGYIVCPVPIGGTTLQMLDAYTGRALRFLTVGGGGVAPVRPLRPLPVGSMPAGSMPGRAAWTGTNASG